MDKETRRIRPGELEKDLYTYRALQGITGYSPAKKELTPDNLEKLYWASEESRKTEVQKEGEYKAARDNAVAAAHVFHTAILEVKNQIRAQYGLDSNEYQSIGLKKKTEYKSRSKKKDS
jgi:hypothetical protein